MTGGWESNTFQTSTFLATAFWKFRKKIMQALDFLHCDHVIKIQCRKSTPCRISFAAVCDLVTFHPCLCKSCIREIFLSSINKNKKYWCFVLPWFSMSMEIEAHQQSSLQWGYKVSWLSICWTWILHFQYLNVRQTACLGRVVFCPQKIPAMKFIPFHWNNTSKLGLCSPAFNGQITAKSS